MNAPAAETSVAGKSLPRPHRRRSRWSPLLLALAALAGLALGLPVVVLVARALTTTSALDAEGLRVVLGALGLSLVTTTISLGLIVVLGTPVALLLARRSFRGGSLLETVIDLPIVLPPSVAGLALLLVLGRRGLLGDQLAALGISLPFTTAAVVIAQTFVAAPFYIRSARAGFAGVDRDLEDMARGFGATDLQVFRRITAVAASPALAAGLVMSWARALGEFGATIMFAGSTVGQTLTLPLVVYGEFQGGDLEASIAAAAILVVAAAGVLVAVRLLRHGRQAGAGGLW
jgi:molybdate transport system permease protein